MPLTFLKIKKGKERFCNWKFCQMWAVVWSDVVRSSHLWVSTDSEQKQGREKQIESKSPPCTSAHPQLLIWSGPQKLIFFLRGQGLHRKCRLPKGKIRLITIWEKPLKFLHYTRFIYFSVFPLLHPNTFFLVLTQQLLIVIKWFMLYEIVWFYYFFLQ